MTARLMQPSMLPVKTMKSRHASTIAANVVLAMCLLLALVVLLLLTSCAAGPSSKTRSLEPTPAITCHEHDRLESLPAYPDVPLAELGPNDTLERALIVIAAYASDTTAQQVWAATAAGVAERNRIKYDRITKCLDAYRADGVIL